MNIRKESIVKGKMLLEIQNYEFKREAINHVIYKIGHLGLFQTEFSDLSTKITIEEISEDYDLQIISSLFISELKTLNRYYTIRQYTRKFSM